MRAPVRVNRYSRALLVTGAAAGAAYLSLIAGGSVADLRQLTVSVAAAAADTSFSLLRATTRGTTSAIANFLTQSSQDPAPVTTIGTAWSTQPTFTVANAFRRMTFLTGTTASVSWTFEPGEMQIRGGSKLEALLLVNHGAAASGNIEFTAVIDEELA